MFIETDCTITHEGRTFEADGAVVTTDCAVGGLFTVSFAERGLI